MKKFLLIAAVLLPAMGHAQGLAEEGAIYDSAGTKIFSLAPTGQTDETRSKQGVTTHTLYRLTDLETGATYEYSPKWERIISAGGIYMEYAFNNRQWYWVEGLAVTKSPIFADRVDVSLARRVYKASSSGMTVPAEGSYPILRAKDMSFIDELGRPVYFVEGSFPTWAAVVLLHKYYEQVYQAEGFNEIRAFREAEALRFGESNSLAQDLIAEGDGNESRITTLSGKHYRMLYFAEIGGERITLSKEQVKRLKNGWILAKDETDRTSSGLVIPRAGYHLSGKEAKARGFEGLQSTDFVLEIKAAPESLAEFRTALTQAVAANDADAARNAPAARQATMDSLSVGILAGGLQEGSGNGYRTAATFKAPTDLAVDSHGNVFVVDAEAIRKITPAGRVSTFAGGARGYVDGHGITARFAGPRGIGIDADDNLYIADSDNHRIRKISPEGYVSTLAGKSPGYLNAWGPSAKFGAMGGIAADVNGNVYVSDAGNLKIRKVSPDGTVTTIGDNAPIKFVAPRSLAADSAGTVYVLDGAAVKKVTHDGNVLLMSQDMTFSSSTNGSNRMLFRDASGLALDNDGNLLLVLREDHQVLRISPDGKKTIVAQNTADFWLGRPNSVAIGRTGSIYLPDDRNKVVHQVTPAGNTGPLPGTLIPKPAHVADEAEPATVSAEEAKAQFAAAKKDAKSNPQAMFELANMYAQGTTGKPDWVRALSSFKKAAKAGHAGAQYELAQRHLDGTVSYGLRITNGDVAAAHREQLAKRQVNAAALFQQSADQGYDLAQYALGHAYLNGEGVTQDSEAGLGWLTKAGDQGLFDAQFDLAEFYRNRNGSRADIAKAAEWYSRAAEQGDRYSAVMKNALLVQADPDGEGRKIHADSLAQADRAYGYYSGSGVDRDLVQAAESFREAAMLGNATAQWMLARMYRDGEGLDRELEQSLSWMTIASELGHPNAQFYLGLMYDTAQGVAHDADLARYWYTQSAEQGQINAQFSLGMQHFEKNSPLFGTQEARAWMEKAAKQGDAQAQYMLASLLLDDTGGAGNRDRAIEWFGKAAAQGHIYAGGR